MTRLGAPLLLLGALLPAPVQAQSVMTGLEGEDGISLEAISLLSELPPLGYSAIELTVKNDTDRDRTWTVRTRASKGWGPREVITSEQTIAVPKRAARTFEILAPLPGVSTQLGQLDLSLLIDGYGVRAGHAYFASRHPHYYEGARPLVGLSARLESMDRDRFLGASSPMFVLKLEPSRLPSDWRALAGLDAIWLVPDDLNELTDQGKKTLLDWVMQGGSLFVCSLAETPAQLPFGSYGLGEIRRLEWDGVGITDAVTQAATSLPKRDPLERERGELHHRIAHQLVNRPLMLVFLLGFGVLIGPLNLFWLARKHRRARLLWTTPLISLLASVLLTVMILLQDGVGGNGHRFAVTLLMPERASEVIFQEQISRTGMLLGTSFPAIEGAFLQPIAIGEGFASPSFQLARDRYSGDWFSTRTVQAQRLELVRASRARIELVGEEEGRPKIASSLPVTLERLLYVDGNGVTWTKELLAPGERAVLVQAEQPDVDAFFRVALQHASPYLRFTVEKRRVQSGWFFATSATSIGIDTLPSIRWKDDQSVFFGPVREGAR